MLYWKSTMYLTMEVRWFYPGALPEQLVAWLDNAGRLPAAQLPRTDHYLRVPGQPTLSIKLRQGNLEVKARLEEAREVQTSPRAVGLLAPWRKWRYPLPLPATGGPDTAAAIGAVPFEGLLVPGSVWIAVEKERRLQRFRLAAGLEVAPVPLGTPTALGCEFELSRVQADGEAWWSVCFEAFGQESGLERALLAVAAKVMGPGWPLPLDVEHSVSYPAWLNRLSGRGEPLRH